MCVLSSYLISIQARSIFLQICIIIAIFDVDIVEQIKHVYQFTASIPVVHSFIHLTKIGLLSSFLPFSVDGDCFTTTHNCTGATKNLDSEEECCVGNGLSYYSNGSGCQICYGKYFSSIFYACCNVERLPNMCKIFKNT